MTREEREKAIKCLKWFKEYNEDDYCGGDRIKGENGDWYYYVSEEDFKVFDTIIEVLSTEPCEDCERIYKPNPYYDCISRQAAIDAMWKLYYQDRKDYGEIPECFPADRARDELEMLPSVQPKPKTEVLDKIRAEINKPVIRDEYSQRQNDYCDGVEFMCNRIKEIIDKYKAESEEV